jgi:putative transposase
LELEAMLGRVTAERDLLIARFGRLPPARRPRFRPFERLRVLWHRALHRLSLKRTSAIFQVSTATLSHWLRAARRGWTRLFVPAPSPRKRDLVGETAALLRWQNPSWDTRRIADALVRLGLRTSRPSIQRKLRRLPPRRPLRLVKPVRKVVHGLRARRPHHVWLADFTTLSWLFAAVTLHIGAVIDAFSRKIVSVGISAGEPDAKWTVRLVSRAVSRHGAPRHLVSDRGAQFTSKRFLDFLKRHHVRQRHGAVGSPNSLSFVERFWRTLKSQWATLWLCWAARPVLERRFREWVEWYNHHRPHSGVDGRTRREVEKRKRRRRPLDVKRDDRWLLERTLLYGQRTMPVYKLKRASQFGVRLREATALPVYPRVSSGVAARRET